MRDLLNDQLGLSSAVLVRPDAVEQLAEDRVERLRISTSSPISLPDRPSSPSPSSRCGSARVSDELSKVNAKTHGVLALERSDEPLQNTLHPLLLGRALRDGREQVWVLAPVSRELGQRHGRQDDCKESAQGAAGLRSDGRRTRRRGHARQVARHVSERLDKCAPSGFLLSGHIGTCSAISLHSISMLAVLPQLDWGTLVRQQVVDAVPAARTKHARDIHLPPFRTCCSLDVLDV